MILDIPPSLKLAVVSFDVEPDCPPYMSSYKGVEEGLPKLLELLSIKRVKATFFFTAVTAKRYPHLARRVVEEGHELGCHGYNHERFDRMDDIALVKKIVSKATRILRSYYDVRSFRAPNLKLPNRYLQVLKENGYFYDSSLALYKPPFPRKPSIENGIARLPATITSSVLRLPWNLQLRIHKRLPRLRVYFSHPWEYIDMKDKPVRFDCKFNTGRKALELLSKLIDHLKAQSFRIVTLREAAENIVQAASKTKSMPEYNHSLSPG